MQSSLINSVAKSNITASETDSPSSTQNTSPPHSSNQNQDIILEEAVIKEFAKLLFLEIIKDKSKASNYKQT